MISRVTHANDRRTTCWIHLGNRRKCWRLSLRLRARVSRSSVVCSKHYDECDASVHGGLTFAEAGKACDTHDDKAEWWRWGSIARRTVAMRPTRRSGAQSRGMNPMRMLPREGGYGEHIWTQG